MSNFQSYLIVGKKETTKTEINKLAKTKNIDLGTPSLDIFTVSPEKTYITISQIREIKNHIYQKPLSLKYKFVIIEEAHRLTPEAQSALLKLLEEPPPSAIIVLEAKTQAGFLPTILSRVLTIKTQQKGTLQSKNLALIFEEKNIAKSLEEIAKIDNPENWLDDEIIALHNLLLIKSQKTSISLQKTLKLIDDCAKTKEMIMANVNPRFALFSLVLNNNLASI